MTLRNCNNNLFSFRTRLGRLIKITFNKCCSAWVAIIRLLNQKGQHIRPNGTIREGHQIISREQCEVCRGEIRASTMHLLFPIL